jgi:hypothetical protein
MGSLDGAVKGYRASDGKVVADLTMPAGAGSARRCSSLQRVYRRTSVVCRRTTMLYAYKVDMSGADPATRVAGSDRIGMAAAVSSATFTDPNTVDTAVLASSEGFADALAGTPLAAKLGAPLLLTPRSAGVADDHAPLDPSGLISRRTHRAHDRRPTF